MKLVSERRKIYLVSEESNKSTGKRADIVIEEFFELLEPLDGDVLVEEGGGELEEGERDEASVGERR